MRTRFTVSPSLRAMLEARRRDGGDEVERESDAFLLDPGLGPASYLTGDGRVLIDGRDWDGDAIREATDDEATTAIVVGAKKTGVAELLALLPPRPSGAVPCATCSGGRWAKVHPSADLTIVCPTCGGRGWGSLGPESA